MNFQGLDLKKINQNYITGFHKPVKRRYNFAKNHQR